MSAGIPETSRRALLAGIVTAPALAVPALAISTEPDPILTTIEAHKAALQSLDDVLRHLGRAETAHWKTKTPDTAAAVDAAHEREDAAGDALNAVEWTLATTVPTSLAGALAALEYQRSRSSDLEELFGWTEQRNAFALSIETAIRNHMAERL